jgi:hypothetical protein
MAASARRAVRFFEDFGDISVQHDQYWTDRAFSRVQPRSRPPSVPSWQKKSMPSNEKIIHLTADYLEERAASRVRDAEQLPPGEAQQHVLEYAAQLRSYAAIRRRRRLPLKLAAE